MRQRTLKPEDLERLLQLKRRIFGTVAKRLLNDPEATHEVTSTQIEGNAGRISKAVRDLGDYVDHIRGSNRSASRYSSETISTYQVNKFEEESAALGVAPAFFFTWQDLHDELFNQVSYDRNYRSRADIDSQEEYDRVGFREINDLHNSEAIYVYWHQNEYRILHVEESTNSFSTAKVKKGYIYPLALEETRIKSILRAIVEAHYQDDYTAKLGRYLNVPADLLKDDDSDFFSTRNFSARAADLTQARFFGSRGYQEEYRHCIAFFEAKLRALAKMDAVVQSKGGYENVAREMRKASMEELLLNAPLVVNYDASESGDPVDDSQSDYTRQAIERKKYKDKYLNTLLLRHSQYFVYETLFGSDESVQYFQNGRASVKEGTPKGRDWEPNEKDVAFIEAVRKDAPCSQENTYAVFQPTC